MFWIYAHSISKRLAADHVTCIVFDSSTALKLSVRSKFLRHFSFMLFLLLLLLPTCLCQLRLHLQHTCLLQACQVPQMLLLQLGCLLLSYSA